MRATVAQREAPPEAKFAGLWTERDMWTTGSSGGAGPAVHLPCENVEGRRRYAEDPEPNWYPGSRTPDGTDSERPSSAFRLPEQRPADPYADQPGSHALPPTDSGQIRLPVRGPEYPTIRPSGSSPPTDQPPAAPHVPGGPAAPTTYGTTPAYDQPTSMVPLAGERPGAADSLYKSRRPVSAVVFAVVTAVLLIPAVLLLVRVTFIAEVTARGVVPAVLLTLGLPLTGLGLYSLAGSGRAGARDAWLRPPLAYLPIGLTLLLAAGLAVA